MTTDDIDKGRALAESGKHTPTPDDTPLPEAEPDISPDDGQPGRRSVAARLVDMAQADYVLGVTDDGEPFGAPTRQPHLALLLRGGRTGLRADLAARYFADTGAAAGGQALTDATLILEGIAATSTPERLHLRVAEHDGTVYIDTGDAEGNVIRITAGQWELTDTAPVRFLRTKLTGPMTRPGRAGNLARLWDFVNVAADDRPVLLAVLVAALVQADVPHPVLALFAEQGSAKSTITRFLVELIDPSPVPLRQAPRDPDSWTTAAAGSWVVALDNLSGIPAWLSDSLCRASTGDGNVKRALYTDAGLAVVRFRRCVILNGIDVGAVRPDLAERLAVVDLKRIERQQRRPESQLAQAWQDALPDVLGGLLDLAAAVHHRLPHTTVDDSPRMADFAKVLAAVDAELDMTGTDRYRQRAEHLTEDTLSANEFLDRLRTCHYQLDSRPRTGAELLELLTPYDDWRRPRDWPRNGREVTALLRRNGPALRTLGWIVENDDGRNHRNTVTWTLKPPPEPTEADGEGRSDSRYSRDSSVLVDGEFGREPGASQPKTGNSRKNITLNSEDEFASDASQDRASNLPCRYCGKAIPAHMKSQRARGYCGAAGCGAAANRVAR